MSRENTIDHLNSLLRGEIAAVETYRQAIEKVKAEPAMLTLQDCHRSHVQRVEVLRQHIILLGGTPATDSGPWGGFAKLVEGGATVLGDKAAISALEEGEDYGIRDYKDHLPDLDGESRELVEQRLMPAQQQTHSALSALKNAV